MRAPGQIANRIQRHARTSQRPVADPIEAMPPEGVAGGKPARSKVGHVNMKAVLREVEAGAIQRRLHFSQLPAPMQRSAPGAQAHRLLIVVMQREGDRTELPHRNVDPQRT